MPLAILKFGSSVLKCAAHLHVAVEEIHRSLLQGTRVVAVVSALGSTTDRLLEEAGPFQRAPDLACHLARGEEATVNLLIQALGRAGIPASRLDADRGGIGTRGPLLEANPVALNREAYGTALAAAPVVVVPGFVGHTLDGRPSLLGRGGSDLTALFLAHTLEAERCRLLKDVAGWYTQDPAAAGRCPPRFTHLAWENALGLGGRIVQEAALLFARNHHLSFQVGRGGHNSAFTCIGPGPSRMEAGQSTQTRFSTSLLQAMIS